MARALKVADDIIARMHAAVVNLRMVNSELAVRNQLIAPNQTGYRLGFSAPVKNEVDSRPPLLYADSRIACVGRNRA